MKDLTLAEGAFLAGLTKGPAYYNPDRYRDRAHERLAYVLSRMKDDGAITAAQATDAEAERLNFAAFARVAPRHRLPSGRRDRARGAQPSPASAA